MTDTTPVRGPDFLPYPLPDRTVELATEVLPPSDPEPGNRWRRAIEALTPWGVAAATAGLMALGSLLLVSLLADERDAGAWLATSTGIAALTAGLKGLQEEQPADPKTVVKGGIGTGVASALISLLLLLGSDDSVAGQPPVQVPTPAPTASAQPAPTPSASLGSLPPGSANLFGIPTQPDQPLTEASTDKGVLTGRVITTSGAPVAGATVTVTRADPADTSDAPGCPLKVTTTTNAQGSYRLQLCQLGDQLGYHVTITSGTAMAMTDLFVNSGRTTVYNVILAVRRA